MDTPSAELWMALAIICLVAMVYLRAKRGIRRRARMNLARDYAAGLAMWRKEVEGARGIIAREGIDSYLMEMRPMEAEIIYPYLIDKRLGFGTATELERLDTRSRAVAGMIHEARVATNGELRKLLKEASDDDDKVLREARGMSYIRNPAVLVRGWLAEQIGNEA